MKIPRHTSVAVLAALAVTVAFLARAGDEPHWATYTVGCTSCHATHKAAGGNLTTAAGNDNLCASCHNLTGLASSFPIETMTKANLAGETGTSHAWGANATNSNAGATPPSNAAMSVRLASGNIVCSTCHNQHLNAPAAITAGTAGTEWARPAPATHTQGAGTGSVAFTAAAAANPKGYLIEIVEVAGAAGTAKFRLSNDGGTSWWGYSGGVWVAYAAGNARLTSTAAIALNDGTNVNVTFSGSYVLGPPPDRYRFYVSYPFLRAPLDSGNNTTGNKFCRDCHSGWTMDHNAVHTYDGTMKQHPVGIVLNANGGGYDRTSASILDGNGAVQPADGNPSNDLKLAPDNTIQCYTCHGMHHSPSSTAAQFTP